MCKRIILKTLIAAATLTATSAYAECFMRSSTVNQVRHFITKIVDIKRYVVPAGQGQIKCNVTFRAEINHVWHTGEGQSIGADTDSIDQVCSQALNAGRSYLLSKIGGNGITAEQELICRDDPIPDVKTVRIGDIVQLSEVAPHPQKPGFFEYQGTSCRWFVESDFDAKRRDVFQHQGIICLLRKGEWQVVDKF